VFYDEIQYLKHGEVHLKSLVDTYRNIRFIASGSAAAALKLRALPSLYGINDIQELNRLFATLAYNSGQEVSYEALSRTSGVAKNTIKKYIEYIEYLEAAFLIVTVRRVDNNSKCFKRAVTLKVYLTNPSMRAALFEPVSDGGLKIEFIPSSLYCYTVGKNTTGHETERRLSRQRS